MEPNFQQRRGYKTSEYSQPQIPQGGFTEGRVVESRETRRGRRYFFRETKIGEWNTMTRLWF